MNDLSQIQHNTLQKITAAEETSQLESIRVDLFGKQGQITHMLKNLSTLCAEDKKHHGKELNNLQKVLQDALQVRKHLLEERALSEQLKKDSLDITLNSAPSSEGAIHPISQVIYEAVSILQNMGFAIANGPEIEDDFHNFTALNVPQDHPARQQQDTFYLPRLEGLQDLVLRTHTSPVQIRTMLNNKPPLRVLSYGRVYRSDYDATHTPVFHQIEGFVIDKNVHMGHLKGCLVSFLQQFFNLDHVPMRYRASYFPFTEPSAEVDIACSRKNNELLIGTGNDWLEILGCGMIHPAVLKNVGIDPSEYQGFAFGMGIERLAMLKYSIPDLRAFYENDKRWLKHFGFSFAKAFNMGDV